MARVVRTKTYGPTPPVTCATTAEECLDEVRGRGFVVYCARVCDYGRIDLEGGIAQNFRISDQHGGALKL